MDLKKHPEFSDIEAAAARLKKFAFETPLMESETLNGLVGTRVLIKPENLQRMGAFKFRGAYNAISRLSGETARGGVTTCSSGNHAQGVAEAARLCGMPAVIVMPQDAPAIKLNKTKAAGADVVTYDRASEDREQIAADVAVERGATFIPPYDNPYIIAGQGTVGLEIMLQGEELGAMPEILLAPCGGGGLIAGLAIAVHHFNPELEVFAVEPEGFDDLARSLKSGKREKNATLAGSICDALLAPTPGKLTFEVHKTHLSGSLAVSDDEVRDAMRFAFNELKLVVEPGGATALAALLQNRLPVEGKTVAIVLSGGNVDREQFAEILAG